MPWADKLVYPTRSQSGVSDKEPVTAGRRELKTGFLPLEAPCVQSVFSIRLFVAVWYVIVVRIFSFIRLQIRFDLCAPACQAGEWSTLPPWPA